MPIYTVTIPVAGAVAYSGIEADSEQEAIQKAMDLPLEDCDEEVEMEKYEKLMEGNVCNPSYTEATAEKEEGDSEDKPDDESEDKDE